MRSYAEGVSKQHNKNERKCGHMAIFYFRPSIIKASSGKSAVASAAYQSAQKLYSEKYGKSFSYRSKEEVIYSEILLPENAPREYLDRQTLWNAVEASQNKSNSRYSRQIIIAVPNEWSREEAIAHSREYIQQTFVNRGMAVDWAYHEKNADTNGASDNHHLHLMCTVRGFNPDGSWASMEKKVYALDENDERIPEIDPKTGMQKVRRRNRDGHYSEEKIWKRITIQTNSWNRRETLQLWKKEWADCCNKYLASDNQIDHRSYLERGIERLPMLHEGSASREMQKRGLLTDIAIENQERTALNDFFHKAQLFYIQAYDNINNLKSIIAERKRHEQTGSITQSGSYDRHDVPNTGVSESYYQSDRRIASRENTAPQDRTVSELSQGYDRNEKQSRRRVRH